MLLLRRPMVAGVEPSTRGVCCGEYTSGRQDLTVCSSPSELSSPKAAGGSIFSDSLQHTTASKQHVCFIRSKKQTTFKHKPKKFCLVKLLCIKDTNSTAAGSQVTYSQQCRNYCLSNAMHGQNINLSVCPSHFLTTHLQVRPSTDFYSS